MASELDGEKLKSYKHDINQVKEKLDKLIKEGMINVLEEFN